MKLLLCSHFIELVATFLFLFLFLARNATFHFAPRSNIQTVLHYPLTDRTKIAMSSSN